MTARLTTNRIWQLSYGLKPRDLEVVRSLAMLRVASVRQLERLHFVGQPRTGRRSLKELVDRRVIVRLTRNVGGARAGSAGHVYALDVVGQSLSQNGGPARGERLRRPWTPGSRFLDHALAVTELYVQLVESTRLGASDLLAFEAEPDAWRTFSDRGALITLKPDAFVRLGVGDEEEWLFIEVDRATESLRTIQTKAELYRAYWESGEEQESHGVFPRVVWLVPTEQHQQQIEGVLSAVGPRELFLTVLAQDFQTTVLNGGKQLTKEGGDE